MKKVHSTHGTVSRGSMRIQDILPACMDVLLEYHPSAYREIINTLSGEVGTTYTELCGDQDNPDWQSELLSWIVHEDMWDAMDEIAPEGYFFGAHPGDGADYGFWRTIEDEVCCWCCGRGDLTLLDCPLCGVLLCQDCMPPFGAHICETD